MRTESKSASRVLVPGRRKGVPDPESTVNKVTEHQGTLEMSSMRRAPLHPWAQSEASGEMG